VGVKISLSKKGCSGLGYNMDYIRQDQIKKFDEIIEEGGIKVVVDNKAIMALIGTEMNFVEDELGSQFVFNNPNEKGKCGCGASFYI
jgi:iron-sulfur cluster assembly accessory protein